jgi:hypothetical protein
VPAGPEAFLLLEQDAAAQRLLVAWPDVPRIRNRHLRLAEWARRAHVSVSDAYRCEPALVGGGLCGADGYVEPNLLTVVRAALMRRTAGRLPQRRAPPGGDG